MTTLDVTADFPITGAAMADTVFAPAELISCMMSIVTLPLSLICGLTFKMTPVAWYEIVCANKFVPAVWTGVTDDDVGTGTSVPTSNWAVPLSETRTDGADNVRTL